MRLWPSARPAMGAQMRQFWALSALDPMSRRRVRILGLKLLITVVFGVALAASHGYPMLAAMAFLCGWQSLIAAMAALLQHQRVDAAMLTGWDEAAIFLGIASLMRLASVILG